MANNVAKYISVTGPVADLCFIYRHIQNVADTDIAHTEYERSSNLGAFLKAIGGDANIIDVHGWSEVWEVYFEGDTMWIDTMTPYGNIHDFMEYLKQRFPHCTFHCLNNENEENDED